MPISRSACRRCPGIGDCAARFKVELKASAPELQQSVSLELKPNPKLAVALKGAPT